MKRGPSTSSRTKKKTTELRKGNRIKHGREKNGGSRRLKASRNEVKEDAPCPSRRRSSKSKKRERPESSQRGRAQKTEDKEAGRRKVKQRRDDDKLKQNDDDDDEEDDDDEIVVNRAPVLTLWVAVVAEKEGFEFTEGLSFGRAVAGLMAQSKGRRLGIYEEASEEEKAERKRKRKGLERFAVFGMRVPGKIVEDGRRLAVQNSQPISPSPVEAYLHRSFGPNNYEKAKAAMEDLADSYSPQEIGKVAYSLYEGFRPVVPQGVKGWGAKGVLDIHSMQKLKKR